MQQTMAVTGYVQHDVAQALAAGGYQGSLDVRPERGFDDVVARLDVADVAEVRVGALRDGESLVQLILVPHATVATVMREQRTFHGLQRFEDPTLRALVVTVPTKVIAA